MICIDSDKLARYFEGKYTAEDEKYVLELFRDESRSKLLKSQISTQWKEFQRKSDIPERDLEHVLHKIHFSINLEKDRRERNPLYRFKSWYYRIAAVILLPLMIASGMVVFQLLKSDDNKGQKGWAAIHSTMGSRVSFNLPDGSSGWLNSGSTLKYALNFNENRMVELEGEAYFDVVHARSHPFYVKTSDIRIKVLGTKFNVKSYPDDKTIETTLLSGLVEIETLSPEAGEGRKLILKPNQKATFRKNIENITVQNQTDKVLIPRGIKEIGIFEDIDTTPITSWKDSRLIFINEPFESLLVKLERWYDVKIALRDSALMKLSYTGKFENETVEQAFNAIKVATPNIDFKINKNNIEIFLKHQ
jgi:transmembrane sensor